MIKQISILIVLSFFAASAKAVIVGDRDWLQVTATTNHSWNDFDAIFDSATGACDVTGCLLGGTVDLTGYIWAGNDDVNELIKSYTGGTGLPNFDTIPQTVLTGPASLDGMFVVFDSTVDTSFSNIIKGLTRDAVGPSQAALIRATNLFSTSRNDSVGYEDLGKVTVDDTTGGWLYRNVSPIPVPAAVWLFGTALLGLLGFSRHERSI